MLQAAIIYILTGCAAGYLAGLFGVGGGIIIVPVLAFLFKSTGVAQDVLMPLAIGTSMSVVSVTSLLSARAHYANGNVDWKSAGQLLPAVLIGVVAGSILGSHAPKNMLSGLVITFEVGVSLMYLTQVMRNHQEHALVDRQWPKSRLLFISALLGSVSSVVGIAGGTLFVPFLNFCGINLRKSIGTATALGAPLGLLAAIVYMLMGAMGHKHLPTYSFGFIYFPAFLGCVFGGIWTTKQGAKLGMKLDIRILKFAFALILLTAAGKMLFI
jgi:uncharacterized membrane protein YfcA